MDVTIVPGVPTTIPVSATTPSPSTPSLTTSTTTTTPSSTSSKSSSTSNIRTRKNHAIGCLLLTVVALGILLAFCFSAETGGFNTTLMPWYREIEDPGKVIYRTTDRTKRTHQLNIAVLTSAVSYQDMDQFPFLRLNRYCYGAKQGHKILLDTINYLLPEFKSEELPTSWNRVLAAKKWLHGYDWLLVADRNVLFIDHNVPIEHWIESAGPGYHVIVPQLWNDRRNTDGSLLLLQNDPLTWNFLDLWWKMRKVCPERNNTVALQTALLEIAGEAREYKSDVFKACHSVCEPEKHAECFNRKIQEIGWKLEVDPKTGVVSGFNHPPIWFTQIDEQAKDVGLALRMEDGPYQERDELFDNSYAISYSADKNTHAYKLYHQRFGSKPEHCLYDTWAGHAEPLPVIHNY